MDTLPRQQVKLVSLRIGSCGSYNRGADDLREQRITDLLGDLVLHRKHVVQFTVVGLREQVKPVAGLDELRGYPNAVAGASHRSLENVSDVEQLADFPEVLVLPLECERRGAAGDLQVRDLREQVEQLLGQAFGEICLVAFR